MRWDEWNSPHCRTTPLSRSPYLLALRCACTTPVYPGVRKASTVVSRVLDDGGRSHLRSSGYPSLTPGQFGLSVSIVSTGMNP